MPQAPCTVLCNGNFKTGEIEWELNGNGTGEKQERNGMQTGTEGLLVIFMCTVHTGTKKLHSSRLNGEHLLGEKTSELMTSPPVSV